MSKVEYALVGAGAVPLAPTVKVGGGASTDADGNLSTDTGLGTVAIIAGNVNFDAI